MNRRSILKSGVFIGAATGLSATRNGHPQAATNRRPNDHADRSLVGKPGSRNLLNTPALLLDVDVMERNLVAMARYCEQTGLALRPHCKTHKSVRIAERQLAHGAIGVCAATIGEAEALIDGGIGGVLVTRPVVTDAQIDRLIALCARDSELMMVVDHPDNVAALGQAAAAAGCRLKLVVDVDVNDHRTGCANVDDAVQLARQIASSDVLSYAGLQAYAGRAQHVIERADQ